MLELALIAVVSMAPGPSGSIRGMVLSEGTGEALEDVHVTMASGSAAAVSDASGAYAIESLPAGSHTLRFSRFGYHDRTVEVVVPAGITVVLDVQLQPRPIAMPAIDVVAERGARPAPRLGGDDPLPPGSRHVAFARGADSPLTNEQDALRALEAAPGVDIAEEAATSLHVRGGSGDQNQILVDGLPVYNAVHSSGVLSAVNPDAVGSVTLHAGAIPARYGGGLSSTVDIITRGPRRDAAFRGGIGPGDLRASVSAPLPLQGGLLFAGRRTHYDLVQRGSFDRGASTGFEEALARVSLPSPAGDLEFLSLHGVNTLSFFADPSYLEDGADAGTTGPDRYSTVRWSTGTDGVTWRSPMKGAMSVQASIWRAATGTSGEWDDGEERVRFDHRLEHLGLEVDVTTSRPWGSLKGGLSLERMSTSFRTRPSDDPAIVLWEIDPQTVWYSAYVEHRWIPHDRWLVNNGARLVTGARRGFELEPRVSVHFRPRDDVALAAGFARVHQYAQSMRNEESALHASFGFDPLVAAGSGVPVARSDQVTASAQVLLAPGLDFEIDAYARSLHGLLLVAPETEQPFAVDGFDAGRGTARGVGAALSYRGAVTDGDLVAEWGTATRRTPDLTYQPTFARKTLLAAMRRRVGAATILRAAFRASSGRPTSALEGSFAWEPFDLYTGEVEFAGNPVRGPGRLNGDRLPAYTRLDLGARRAWRPSFLGPKGALVTWLDVLNVLGRKNVLALVEGPSEADGRRPVHLGGTAVSFGVEWSF